MALPVKCCPLIPSAFLLLRGTPLPTTLIPVRGLIALPIEWRRPERLPYYHPLKTGDGTTHLTVDMDKAPVMVEKSKEYEKADDLVRRMFSFNYVGRKYAVLRARGEMIESVRNHMYDNNSTEVQIARQTARIRNLMEHLENQRAIRKSDKRATLVLNTSILKRRRRIRNLRKFDYKRYEWLLEKLDLIYTPYPEEPEYVERKKSVRKLTDQYCENFKQGKLNEYKELLESKKADFLREKVDSLKWIRQEEIDCGVEPTVGEEDIQKAVDTLEQHLRELSLKPVIKDETRNILANV